MLVRTFNDVFDYTRLIQTLQNQLRSLSQEYHVNKKRLLLSDTAEHNSVYADRKLSGFSSREGHSGFLSSQSTGSRVDADSPRSQALSLGIRHRLCGESFKAQRAGSSSF